LQGRRSTREVIASVWQALQGANLVLQDYASGSRPLIDAALVSQKVDATIVQEIGHPAIFPDG
jgi:hypothetical protein